MLHANAVIIDARYTLLTSANFTEAAQQRNIEAGVLLDDPRLATRLSQQFNQLLEMGHFAAAASVRRRNPDAAQAAGRRFARPLLECRASADP